jgi:DNA-binding NtrC family response regulator
MSAQNSMPRRALVVDDELDICNQLREALESARWDVQICVDGKEAIQAVPDFSPTVVVLDLRMPKVDGTKVLAWIREQRPWTAVIVLTGHGTESDAIECCNKHAFRFFQKIVSPFVIVTACEEALDSYPDEVIAFYQWFAALPDPTKVVYHTASGRTISAQQLMEEIQRQSPEGREFMRQVAAVAVELVTKRL